MKHIKFCESNAPLEVRMPISSPTIEFVNLQKTQRVSVVVYAHLEAIGVCSVDVQRIGSTTKGIETQYPCSFRAILVDDRSWFSLTFFENPNMKLPYLSNNLPAYSR